MSQTWDLGGPVVSDTDLKLARLVREIFGDKFPHINENVTKAMSLYGYLAKHVGESANTLAKQIRNENGGSLFSENDIREIQAVLKKQKNEPYFKRASGQTGGGPTSPLDADPSRSKFFDKMIRKIMYPISQKIPPSWDGILWYTFLIYNLEQTEFLGPFLSTAMDTITLSLPVMAELAATGFEKLISLAPVPYASFAGEIIGYAVSLVFIIFAVFLNIGRKHFGSAFKVSLEAIPVFGDMLMDAAQSVETGAERYLQNRNKLLNPVEKISPTLYQTADYYVPDTNVHPVAPPPLNYDAVKKNVAGYVLKETGIADTIASASAMADPTALATGALAKAVDATPAKPDNAKPDNAKPDNAKPDNANPKAAEPENTATNTSADPTKNNAKTAFPPTKIRKSRKIKGGRHRKTRRR